MSILRVEILKNQGKLPSHSDTRFKLRWWKKLRYSTTSFWKELVTNERMNDSKLIGPNSNVGGSKKPLMYDVPSNVWSENDYLLYAWFLQRKWNVKYNSNECVCQCRKQIGNANVTCLEKRRINAVICTLDGDLRNSENSSSEKWMQKRVSFRCPDTSPETFPSHFHSYDEKWFFK